MSWGEGGNDLQSLAYANSNSASPANDPPMITIPNLTGNRAIRVDSFGPKNRQAA